MEYMWRSFESTFQVLKDTESSNKSLEEALNQKTYQEKFYSIELRFWKADKI